MMESIPFPSLSQRIGLTLLFVIVVTGVLIDLALLPYMRRHPLTKERLARFTGRASWQWTDAAWLIMLFFGGQIATVLSVRLLTLFEVLAPSHTALANVLIQATLFPVLGLAVVAALMRFRGNRWSHVLFAPASRPLRDIGMGAVCYLAAVPLVLSYGHYYGWLLDALGYPVEPQPVLEMLLDPSVSLGSRCLLIALAVAAVPFMEEFIFRGMVLRLTLKHLGPTLAVVVVSAGFAALHFHVPSLIPLFVLAGAFSLAALYTNSLIVPIVMHALFNGISIVLQILLRDFDTILQY